MRRSSVLLPAPFSPTSPVQPSGNTALTASSTGEYVMVGERHPFESNAGHGGASSIEDTTCPGRTGTRRDSGFGDQECVVMERRRNGATAK